MFLKAFKRYVDPSIIFWIVVSVGGFYLGRHFGLLSHDQERIWIYLSSVTLVLCILAAGTKIYIGLNERALDALVREFDELKSNPNIEMDPLSLKMGQQMADAIAKRDLKKAKEIGYAFIGHAGPNCVDPKDVKSGDQKIPTGGDPDSPRFVFALVYFPNGDYRPAEILALFSTEYAANGAAHKWNKQTARFLKCAVVEYKLDQGIKSVLGATPIHAQMTFDAHRIIQRVREYG